MKTRIITLNLAGFKADWFERRRHIVVRGLKELEPDIVCFQETTLCRGYEAYDQARDIGDAIGLPVVAFTPYGNPVEIMSSQQGGLAIISRWPIIRARNRRLPAAHDTPPDARVALFTTFQTPMGELKVVTTHLSWEPEGVQVRLMQIGLILEDLFQGKPMPADARFILTGDMNAVETEPAIHLLRECFEDAYRKLHPTQAGYTWAMSNPLTEQCPIADRRLDYIFCPRAAHVRSAEVILNQAGADGYASDHFGVMADLEY